jgi:hypothetical protein
MFVILMAMLILLALRYGHRDHSPKRDVQV